jgi:hypothetical protein
VTGGVPGRPILPYICPSEKPRTDATSSDFGVFPLWKTRLSRTLKATGRSFFGRKEGKYPKLAYVLLLPSRQYCVVGIKYDLACAVRGWQMKMYFLLIGEDLP